MEPSTKEKQKHDSAVFIATREVGHAQQNLAIYPHEQLLIDLTLDIMNLKLTELEKKKKKL